MSKTEYIQARRKSTMATTVRLDARTFATLALFWRKSGEPMISQAQVTKLSLEAFRDMITKQHPELEVETVTDAVEVLRNLGLIDLLGKKHRNHASLIEALSLEDAMLGQKLNPAKDIKHTVVKGAQGEFDVSQRMLEELQERLNAEEDEDIKDRLEDLGDPTLAPTKD
jgi:signal transduction protein with GAF and PtsI domain